MDYLNLLLSMLAASEDGWQLSILFVVWKKAVKEGQASVVELQLYLCCWTRLHVIAPLYDRVQFNKVESAPYDNFILLVVALFYECG